MRKVVASFLAFALILSLCACGSSPNRDTQTKYAYMLSFSTHAMYYLFDTETNTATTFTYYKDDKFVADVFTSEIDGELSGNSSVKLSFTDGIKPWTEKVVFDSKMSSIKVSIIDDPYSTDGTPYEVTYLTTDVKNVVSLLEKNGNK